MNERVFQRVTTNNQRVTQRVTKPISQFSGPQTPVGFHKYIFLIDQCQYHGITTNFLGIHRNILNTQRVTK